MNYRLNPFPEFVQLNGEWWQESRSYTFPEEAGDTPFLVSTQRQRLTGLGEEVSGKGVLVAESASIDLHGNESVSLRYLDRSNKTVRTETHSPFSTDTAVQIAVDGLLREQISQTGVVTAYDYDALGRRTGDLQVAPGRQTGSTTAYNALGQVESVTDALDQTTHTAYDAQGRRGLKT